ncbi:MAG: bifunctional demethylmenaquinone methyltransferase/2-methoxy-6-polyprenyl-1,4-benzoquinol methylase UbiE [Planctomycetes bacterium]|nr:bifunctional demethylmenaquinone methyltransferase/2-methoxy-6-polyprenyl-1,4-benzoquinol methylase UbiE [Planctomycetota bacterium]
MFAAIAHSYDLNNRVHSLWRDQAWRRCAVRRARVNEGDVVLDVACGTGDLTQAFAASNAQRVIGIDFTPQMLDVARTKLTRLRPQVASKIEYRQGDAMALDIDDASVDIVSIAFGLRNVAEPEKAIAEFARVLRPGGRAVILEFSRPTNRVARWCSELYTRRIMPVTARLISRDREGAYRYLPQSVLSFVGVDELCERLGRAGFARTTTTPLSLGIVTIYVAQRD